jgi:hypothetical protein
MPTRPVVELKVALLGSGVLAARGKLQDERELAVVGLPIIAANFCTPAPNALAKLVFFADDRSSPVQSETSWWKSVLGSVR